MSTCASTPSTAAEPVFGTVVSGAWAGRRYAAYGLAALLAAGCDGTPPAALPVSALEAPAACDLERGCSITGENLSLQLRFDAPARALQSFPLSLHTSGDQPVEAVVVTFFMRGMDMGLNRYRLDVDTRGDWKGRVTLPVCVSGRSDWIAAVELTTAVRKYEVRIPFVLQK
jgi:hypothetical protein